MFLNVSIYYSFQYLVRNINVLLNFKKKLKKKSK